MTLTCPAGPCIFSIISGLVVNCEGYNVIDASFRPLGPRAKVAGCSLDLVLHAAYWIEPSHQSASCHKDLRYINHKYTHLNTVTVLSTKLAD